MAYPRILPTAIVCSALTLGVLAPTAHAQDPSDSATGTVQISAEIRSVTVEPEAFEFPWCWSATDRETEGLTFPNGRCQSTPLVVTNGDAPAHVFVHASPFEGSEGGPTWAIVSASSLPGEDEATIELFTQGEDGGSASDVNGCDANWTPTNTEPGERCAAEPGQSLEEFVHVTGPSASTNASPSFSTTITWTAMP